MSSPSVTARLMTFGPFFAVDTHSAGAAPEPPWRTMAELADGSGVLRARIGAVRDSLAARVGRDPNDVDARAAASIAHLGLVARVIAPTVAARTDGQTHVSQSLTDLWWQDHLGGPFPLSVTMGGEPGRDGPGPVIEAITRAVIGLTGVSERVLWGNVGSAANSAARLICASAPDLSGAAHAAADAYLRDPRIDDGALRAGPQFRRRSCCLIYQVSDDRSAVCGDCVLG